MLLLITGCAGFIGARTARLALEAGHQVVGLDNLNDYYDPQLKHHRLTELKKSPRFSFHPIDIEDGLALDQIFLSHRFDAVINLAARAGVRASIDDPHVYMRTNTAATLNLLERMMRHGVGKFVIASTSSLYAGQPMPFTEDANVTRPISRMQPPNSPLRHSVTSGTTSTASTSPFCATSPSMDRQDARTWPPSAFPSGSAAAVPSHSTAMAPKPATSPTSTTSQEAPSPL